MSSFRSLLPAVLAVLLHLGVNAQQRVPVLRATGSHLSMRVDTLYTADQWHIDSKINPDVFEVAVSKKPIRVAFISGKDSLVHTVKAGETYNFIVLTTTGDSAHTAIKGIPFVEPAIFSKVYIASHTGKTFVEIPDMYELVNIVFALTKLGKEREYLIEKDTPYYQQVLAYFNKYESERIVSVMDSVLRVNEGNYFPLKMDAYSLLLDTKGKVQPSPVYDRISWGRSNTLRPYLPLLQDFAQKTNFSAFYASHRPYYTQLIKAYEDSLGVADMQRWLNKNFPTTSYNSFKIIFSPLVSGNQSAQWFANNGFKEAQAHVNYPFVSEKDRNVPAQVLNVRRGNIVFTELNHAFINPEADKYSAKLVSAITNLDYWLADGKPAKQGYNNVFACFNEYMNWGLVSLRYADLLPADQLNAALTQVEKMMVERRGFKRFAEFNQFLLASYQNRPGGKTVADLYPQIVEWFASQKQ